VKPKEIACHLLFGSFTIFLVWIAIHVAGIWLKLDAGVPLKAVIVLQAVCALSFAVSLWRATILWITLDSNGAFTPWPIRIKGDSQRHIATRRWRRAALYSWCALVANTLIGALLL
jgi:hypothetical protein